MSKILVMQLYYYTSVPGCWKAGQHDPIFEKPRPELFIGPLSNIKVSFTSSSLPALIKENICFSNLASSSYNRIERGLLEDQFKTNPV